LQSIALKGADVYFLDHGKGVYRLSGGAGTPTQVVPPVSDTAVGHTMVGGVLQVDDSFVYFAQDESLYRAALANPTAELLVTAANDITQVESDGSYLYYVVSQAGTISRIPVAGGTPEELVPAEASAQSMQLLNGTIYFVNFELGEVGRLPAAGGTIQYLTPYDDASEVVLATDTTLYFSDWSSLYSAPMSNPKQLKLLGSGGGERLTDSSFDKIALAGDRIYWFDSGENVGWTKTDGSQCGLLFKGSGSRWVTDIAVTSDSVYVAVDKSLIKLPR
jgi:tricorn protease-like protein